MDNIQQTYTAFELKYAETMAEMKRHDEGHHEWHAMHGDKPCTSEEECAAMARSYHKEEGVTERTPEEVREVRSSWIVQAEGLAGNQSNATEYPLFGVGGSTRNIDIPEEVDQGTSTEALTASIRVAIDYPNPPDDFDVPYFRQISRINDNIPELDLTGKNTLGYPLFKPAAEGEEFLSGPANQNASRLYQMFLKVRDFYRARAGDSYHRDEHSDFYQASHHRGHVAHFYDNHQNYMDAVDNWNNLRGQFHPFTFGAFPSDEQVEQMNSALVNVDHAFRELHHHLHTTCTRSDQKGGPCGHWGIPRGSGNCEYCKDGNPTRDFMSMWKRAEKKPEDENWEITTSPFQFQPIEPTIPANPEKAVNETPAAPAYPEAEGLNYVRPHTELPEDMKSQLETVPDFSSSWTPLPEQISGDRGFFAVDKALEPHEAMLHHLQSHIQAHRELFSRAVHAADQHHQAKLFFKQLEYAIGDSPSDEQLSLLTKQNKKVQDLEGEAKETRDVMHQHWHEPCDQCTIWNNERGSDCQFCAAGDLPNLRDSSIKFTTSWSQ